MLELEVGIWSFEGCVSFLGFPRPANPLAPKTENPPRRQSDHAVCIFQLLAAPLPQTSPRCSAAFRCGGGLGPAEIGGPNPSGSVASSTARAR